MELDMYGDPVKKCCVKDCKDGAVLTENNKHYCPDHYSIEILLIPLSKLDSGKDD